MTQLSPRLQPLFEKTKTVCFGRFLIDVPESTTVVWGHAQLPWEIMVLKDGAKEINELAEEKISALKAKRNIHHNKPLFISETAITHPPGKIVTGYEDFQSINAVQIDGYFSIGQLGVFIDAGDFLNEPSGNAAKVINIVQRLRPRSETEIPSESGNCIENAFLADEPDKGKARSIEHIRIGFRLKEFDDVHISIHLAPSNPNHTESNTLEWQLSRLEKDLKTENPNHPRLKTRYMRRGARQIHDWLNGYEALSRTPEQPGMHSAHDFAMDFKGVPFDLFRPYADIRMETGVAGNAAGATKPSLTDDEAIAVWDKITSTIRVRKEGDATPIKTTQAPSPVAPLGELAATGRACPQSGWWQCVDAGEVAGGRRRHFNQGEVMPDIVLQGPPTLWQRLKGERPTYRTTTVWKLMAYNAPPPPISAATAPTNPEKAQGQGAGDGAESLTESGANPAPNDPATSPKQG